MSKTVSSADLTNFDDHAHAIAKRQYFEGRGDTTLREMFQAVADWVAQPEADKEKWAEIFFNLFADKKFCSGGRTLAGANTNHNNGLNCFVQGSNLPSGTDAWVLDIAKKLALTTKIGGGNGVNLDPLPPKGSSSLRTGRLYLELPEQHADFTRFMSGSIYDFEHRYIDADGNTKIGDYVERGYRYAVVGSSHAAYAADALRLTPHDSIEGIWDAAIHMTQALIDGHDVVVDLSNLRSEGSPVHGTHGTSSGPASFALEVFDSFGYWASLGGARYAGPVATLRYVYGPTLRVIRQAGVRRGAGMATLTHSHPDLDDFVTCKDLEREQAEGDIRTFNISVLATDSFMDSARKQPSAAAKLTSIADHAWQTGEPGLIFIDRINEHNPMLKALGEIKATNPCGEIPLYPGEPCDLGAMNLAAYVTTPNIGLEGFDDAQFRIDVGHAVRFLDNVLDVNEFALDDNREMSHRLRRIGLGLMGLADALILMGYPYNSEDGSRAAYTLGAWLRSAAVSASEELAKERGAFPDFGLSDLKTPRRNVAVVTVAPTGTTSMLMGVSSGVEPIFAPFIYRKIGESYHALIAPLFEKMLRQHKPHENYQVHRTVRRAADNGDLKAAILDEKREWVWDMDKVVEAIQANHGSVQGLEFLPEAIRRVFVCAHDITPSQHVEMQSAVQRSFDADGGKASNSISKTINMPNGATVEDVESAYYLGYEKRLKGMTVYRDGSRTGQVLSTKAEKKEKPKPKQQSVANTAARCPLCSTQTRMMDGCETCINADCGWSKCEVR